jgi:hypothetical protein
MARLKPCPFKFGLQDSSEAAFTARLKPCPFKAGLRDIL